MVSIYLVNNESLSVLVVEKRRAKKKVLTIPKKKLNKIKKLKNNTEAM